MCGSVGDMFDHLTEQDLVSFTGSAATARQLRAHPVVVARAVRFNAEADSLNCSILGPDAGPGTAEFDLYVKQLVTEMIVKAGQKCTAIRRALVPAGVADAVTEAVSERLAKVVVGSPAERTVGMGALASLEQREEVRRSVKALLAGARLVFGDPSHVEVVGADPGARRLHLTPCCCAAMTSTLGPSRTTRDRGGSRAGCDRSLVTPNRRMTRSSLAAREPGEPGPGSEVDRRRGIRP